MFPEMTSTGIIVVRDRPVAPNTAPRLEGHIVRPNEPQALQDLSWVFPELNYGHITVQRLRNRLRWQWCFLTGLLSYRTYMEEVDLDESWQ